MAWNDNNNQTPPELDEVIKDFKNKFNSNQFMLKNILIFGFLILYLGQSANAIERRRITTKTQ